MGSRIIKGSGWVILGLGALAYAYALGLKFKLILGPSLLKNHLADLLFIPLWLSISLYALRLFRKELKILPPKAIFFLSLYGALCFEGILPLISTKFTADFKDLIAYALGGFVYHFFQKKIFKV